MISTTKAIEFTTFGNFKTNSLNMVAQQLSPKQIMKVKRCSMQKVPRNLQHFPDITDKTNIQNGANIWMITQDGCFHIKVLRG